MSIEVEPPISPTFTPRAGDTVVLADPLRYLINQLDITSSPHVLRPVLEAYNAAIGRALGRLDAQLT